MCKYINIFYINTLLIHKKVFYIYKISIKSKRRNVVLVDVDWWLGVVSQASWEHRRINKN